MYAMEIIIYFYIDHTLIVVPNIQGLKSTTLKSDILKKDSTKRLYNYD